MVDETDDAGPAPSRESAWARKRRLAEVFGDVLPETTSDDRDDTAASDEDVQDRWLKSQVPPHHG
jgi:hypothetical protein